MTHKKKKNPFCSENESAAIHWLAPVAMVTTSFPVYNVDGRRCFVATMTEVVIQAHPNTEYKGDIHRVVRKTPTKAGVAKFITGSKEGLVSLFLDAENGVLVCAGERLPMMNYNKRASDLAGEDIYGNTVYIKEALRGNVW